MKKAKTEKEYRWEHPHEWLYDTYPKLKEHSVLINKIDADEIQDIYQNEMDDAGYFEKCYLRKKKK